MLRPDIVHLFRMMTSNRDSPTSKDTPPLTPDGEHEGDWSWLNDNNNTQATSSSADQKAKPNGLRYGVSDVPPLGLSIVLGIQHYLTMLGATFLSKCIWYIFYFTSSSYHITHRVCYHLYLCIVPLLVCPAMGADMAQTGQVVCTMFFVSGLNTLVSETIYIQYDT